ncbi:LysR family transcriptional regulator [Streptomyces griseorubiginosus]|uniref:LysR family transcriptional regulator n=1 Tax=Streptomyces griseorubiginosus TaxID=67304 RepID=UPI0036E97B20
MFKAGAERLGIAQPPLSRAIGRLERRMSVQLFERTSRRVGLTAAGAVFLAECRKVLTAVDTAVSRAQRSGRPHRLTVAALRGTGSGLPAGVLRSYRRRPGAADVDVVFARDQVDFVRNGSADFALTCGHEGLEGVEFTELAQERTVALLPVDHFRAAKSAISSADLASEGIFRPDWPEGTLDEIIDQVAMGAMIVMVGASATDRIGTAVVAVPVTDVPLTQLVLTWGPGIPAATRNAFVRTAKNVTAKHVSAAGSSEDSARRTVRTTRWRPR